MSASKLEILSKLFRQIEAEIGTRDLAVTVFESLKTSIESLKVEKDAKHFCKQFHDLKETVSSTEPKFGILNYHFERLESYFDKCECSKKINLKNWKKKAVIEVKKILKEFPKIKKELMKNVEKIDVDGKTILIHDQSHNVQDALKHLKRIGKKFKVVVAEQDHEKTQSNIEFLDKNNFSFQVVPSYMLSHVVQDIDIVFCGAVTLKNNMTFVMSPGSHSLISEFVLENVPIYVILASAKFSLWKSKKRTEVFIHKHQRRHLSKSIVYERIKYSHDRVPTSMFKATITDKGVFSEKKLEEFYNKRLNKYLELKGEN